jgi:hypothetical protein
MTFEHILAFLKLLTGPFKVTTDITRKEKAPIVASPASSTLALDGRDVAIIFMSIALVFAGLTIFYLAIVASRR